MSGYINRNTGSPIQCAAIFRQTRKQVLAYYIRLTVLQFCLELKSLNFNAFSTNTTGRFVVF